MGNARILVMGVLALTAVLVISAVIVAMAPYLAVTLVVMGVCWLVLRDGSDPPNELPTAPTKSIPKE